MNVKPMMRGLGMAVMVVSTLTLYGCFGDRPTTDQAPAADAMAAEPVPAESAPAPAPVDSTAAAPAPESAPVAAASPVADTVVPDATLSARVKAALAKHPGFGLGKIQVSAHEGVVHLTGAVASSVQIDQAEYIVGEVEGVREVDNRLKAAH